MPVSVPRNGRESPTLPGRMSGDFDIHSAVPIQAAHTAPHTAFWHPAAKMAGAMVGMGAAHLLAPEVTLPVEMLMAGLGAMGGEGGW